MLRPDFQSIRNLAEFARFANANWNTHTTDARAEQITSIHIVDPVICPLLIKLETTDAQTGSGINCSQALAL
jgi:hypothetical protein